MKAMQAALQAAICEGVGDGGVDSAPGLEVYRHAYRARLRAALRDNYLVLHRALGDEAFDALADAYIQARPSTTPSIRWFGEGLAGFLEGPLAEIARMDWALRGAFDAADAKALAAEALQALAPEDWPALRLQLQPSVQLLALGWAVEPVWKALRAWEAGEAEPDLPEPEAAEHTLLIWRDATLETRWRSLDAPEARCLEAIRTGADFAAVSEHAGSAEAVVRFLQAWLSEGLLLAA